MSEGKEDIVKAIQFSYLQDLNTQPVYNLGFGDYNIETDALVDTTNSNNGDHYRVLNTVLSTIPPFLETYPNAVLMVHGSDGRPDFEANCKATCTKNCIMECKNFKRRINIYRRYLDKNYDELNADYQFKGGVFQQNGDIYLEDYIPRKIYDAVLLSKRNV